MKSTIIVETLGVSKGVYVSLGEHTLKTYDSMGKDLKKVVATAQRYAKKWVKKYWNGKGIIETYNYDRTLAERVEM